MKLRQMDYFVADVLEDKRNAGVSDEEIDRLGEDIARQIHTLIYSGLVPEEELDGE